jgi:hypothetical protein
MKDENLLRTDATSSGISLQMISRFNGANENGTQAGGPYPIDPTRDSLFGNTELFNALENITPIFKLTGLNTNAAYNLQFYASRRGVGDTWAIRPNRDPHRRLAGVAVQYDGNRRILPRPPTVTICR